LTIELEKKDLSKNTNVPKGAVIIEIYLLIRSVRNHKKIILKRNPYI